MKLLYPTLLLIVFTFISCDKDDDTFTLTYPTTFVYDSYDYNGFKYFDYENETYTIINDYEHNEEVVETLDSYFEYDNSIESIKEIEISNETSLILKVLSDGELIENPVNYTSNDQFEALIGDDFSLDYDESTGNLDLCVLFSVEINSTLINFDSPGVCQSTETAILDLITTNIQPEDGNVVGYTEVHYLYKKK